MVTSSVVQEEREALIFKIVTPHFSTIACTRAPRLWQTALLATGVALASCATGAHSNEPPLRPAPSAGAPLAPLASGPELPAPAPNAAVKNISLAEAGLDPSAIDATVNPCDDLYRHACGKWVDAFENPAGTWGYEKTFSAGTDRTHLRLREILEGLPTKSPTQAEKRLGDFYRSCMDVERIDRRGAEPIQTYLRRVTKATTLEELAAVVGDVHPAIDALFSFGTEPNPTDTRITIALLREGGIRSPLSTDDYLSETPEAASRRAEYEAFAVRMLVDANLPKKQALEVARDAMKVQRALAAAMKHNGTWEREPTIVDLATLEQRAPGFPWRGFFQRAGLTTTDAIHVPQMGFIEEMARFVQSAELKELKHYAYWRIVADMSSVLGKPFSDERAKISRALRGYFFDAPRWKTCVDATAVTLGDLVTKEYVRRYFRPETRQAVRTMFDGFVAAFGDRLGELDWLDEGTRQSARTKLSMMRAKIGYPDGESPDDGVAIHLDTYAENVLVAKLARGKREFANVGAAVDRSTWGNRSPLETNAITEPLNTIVNPAAVLEPPFFDLDATIPVRYGAIGFHLGHEMTHCFDVGGSRLDGAGNLKNWWTPEAWKNFEAKTSCVENPVLCVRAITRRTCRRETNAQRECRRSRRTENRISRLPNCASRCRGGVGRRWLLRRSTVLPLARPKPLREVQRGRSTPILDRQPSRSALGTGRRRCQRPSGIRPGISLRGPEGHVRGLVTGRRRREGTMGLSSRETHGRTKLGA